MKTVIRNWSITQSLNFTEQLNAGIRYFDLRVSIKKHGSKGKKSEKQPDELRLIHGLFGPTHKATMEEICEFLESHPKEIILLDFNHFYHMDKKHHSECVDSMKSIFGDKLCPYQTDTESLTFKFMWENGYQVIVFYHHQDPNHKLDIDPNDHLWPGSYIPSAWLNVSKLSDFKLKLDEMFRKRITSAPDGKAHNSTFHVCQGVLTPVASQIVGGLASSLKEKCSDQIAAYYVDWLKSTRPGKNGINICIIDFVETENYIRTVIRLNEKLLKKPLD